MSSVIAGERHAEGEGCASQPAGKGSFTGTIITTTLLLYKAFRELSKMVFL